MTVPGLALNRLTVDRGGRRLVDLDLTVAPGEVLTIMGGSGTGKSTALAAIIGTHDSDAVVGGRILLNGRDIGGLPTRLRRIGLMFQDALLFPHLSVGGNLAFALPPGTPDRPGAIERALAEAGLTGFAERDPDTLSGGERARVALMRTLLAAPEALLLDEPFSRLDAALRHQVRSFVLDLARTRGLPVILVTHDADDARAAAGRVISPMGEPA